MNDKQYQLIMRMPESYRWKLRIIAASSGTTISAIGYDLIAKFIEAYEKEYGEVKVPETK